MGKNSRANRDAIVNANSSLKANPDKMLEGKSYRIPAANDAPVTPAVASSVPEPAPTAVAETTQVKPATELQYTAVAGDTVGNLARAFLGSDSKAHQDAIIDANASLRANPDRLIVGQAYRIPAPHGLSTPQDAAPAAAKTAPVEAQPDADQIVADGALRTLRYTAKSGDTVTTLAVQLLGSDTQQARDAIINNNPSLKRDPDHLVAGQTYWIPAPVAGHP